MEFHHSLLKCAGIDPQVSGDALYLEQAVGLSEHRLFHHGIHLALQAAVFDFGQVAQFPGADHFFVRFTEQLGFSRRIRALKMIFTAFLYLIISFIQAVEAVLGDQQITEIIP